MLLSALRKQGKLSQRGEWPLPLAIVLYNGATPWTEDAELRDLFALDVGQDYAPAQKSPVVDLRRARVDGIRSRNLTRAVAGIEQAVEAAELMRIAKDLDEWLGPSDAELRRVFVDWMAGLLGPGAEGERVIAVLEDADMMTLAERAAERSKQLVEEGRAQGVAQGVAQERTLLRRMTASRFGTAVGTRLAERVAAISDPECLAEVGECLVTAETADEFLAGVARATAT